ncbi:thymidylate kinase [Pseudomonas sp. S75]|uniref:dTMP kinase n=1 Tax=unclassified Pseudomonas TaxID=196821 RepID=UPI001907DCDA|nr:MULTISPECIES: dTMP kinase [unclassified Pseudomonas]MBJ9977299.1 thymidylate kinase [Pseudomonas sp. S30]MBK0155460.1 thymidylate kinase [Pseudomonas sp. S75]
MNPSLFVSLDGPKGVGKTTLLEALALKLRRDGYKVVRLSERNHDPYRAEIMALVNALARQPDIDLERRVCARLADSRAWISRHVLPNQLPGSVILMDRWFASDAAFRRGVPFEDILRFNLQRAVQVPDLQVAVVTPAPVSWARAKARRAGLRSTVVQTMQEHEVCTESFERAMVDQGWLVCHNEGPLETVVSQLAAHVLVRLQAGALSSRAGGPKASSAAQISTMAEPDARADG